MAEIRGAALLTVACLIAAPAAAQTPPGAPVEQLDAQRQQLDQTKANQQRIREEIQALAQERSRLSQELVATASRIRDTETRLTASEQRLADLAETEGGLRKRFQSERAVMAELLGALQRMGRQPPPALLVRPDDALAAIRSAILLGAILPEIRGKAESLAADLEELARVRRAASVERNRLAA